MQGIRSNLVGRLACLAALSPAGCLRYMDADRDAIAGTTPRLKIVGADGGLMHGARGVDVRLLLPGFTDSWLAFHGGRSHYDALLAGGVRIFEHRDALLHAKTAVIDGVWSTIGSSNIDWRSFCHKDEINSIIIGESFGAEMTRVFNDDLAAAVEVTATDWAQRDAADRLREWLARRWDRWL